LELIVPEQFSTVLYYIFSLHHCRTEDCTTPIPFLGIGRSRNYFF